MKYTRKNFTLIEILVVISIIIILLGLTLPSLQNAKLKSKAVRWFAYNNGLNRDPDLVLNYNFQNPNVSMDTPKGISDVVINGGIGCGFDGFKPEQYNAIMMNSPEWRHVGRWRRFDYSMTFDGFTNYLFVPGNEVLKLTPGTSDFTVAGWVKFDTLNGLQTVVSKSIWPNYSVFIIYSQGNVLKADVGSTTLSYSGKEFQAGQWIHFALVADGANLSWYINGIMADSSAFGSGGQIVILHVPQGGGEAPQVMVIGAAGWNGHKNHAGDSILSTDPNAYFQQNYPQNILDSKVIIGAAGMLDAPPNYFFKGSMDEIILSRRAWTSGNVNGHYSMGSPF